MGFGTSYCIFYYTSLNWQKCQLYSHGWCIQWLKVCRETWSVDALSLLLILFCVPAAQSALFTVSLSGLQLLAAQPVSIWILHLSLLLQLQFCYSAAVTAAPVVLLLLGCSGCGCCSASPAVAATRLLWLWLLLGCSSCGCYSAAPAVAATRLLWLWLLLGCSSCG